MFQTKEPIVDRPKAKNAYLTLNGIDVSGDSLWIEPKVFGQRLPPEQFTMEFLRAKIQVDASTFYCMSGPNQQKIYGKSLYQEIKRPEHLIYT